MRTCRVNRFKHTVFLKYNESMKTHRTSFTHHTVFYAVEITDHACAHDRARVDTKNKKIRVANKNPPFNTHLRFCLKDQTKYL